MREGVNAKSVFCLKRGIDNQQKGAIVVVSNTSLISYQTSELEVQRLEH